MTLIPNQPFAEGDEWTPDLAYLAFQTPVFDDQPQYLGHRERLQDGELDNSPDSIKGRVALIQDGLKVTAGSGLVLNYQAGTLRLPDGSILVKSSGAVLAPDNATSFIYADPLGNIVVGLVPTVVRCLMAKVTTVGGIITAVEDLRNAAVRAIAPIAASVKIFGGSNPTDKVCTQGEILDQGVYYFRNFTVPAGVTITVDKWARLYCSGNVEISGTVQVTQLANGAIGYGQVAGATGGTTGTGIGGGSGSGGGAEAYSFAAQPYGSGGGLGFSAGTGAIDQGNGGKGGGGFWIEAAGTLRIRSSAAVYTDGGIGRTGVIINGADVAISGNGGGSGGFQYYSSLTSVVAESGAILAARGADGTPALRVGARSCMGGSGGAGGVINCSAPEVNLTGANVLVTGGLRGASLGANPGDLGGGGGGSFGGAGGGQSNGSTGRLIVRLFTPIGS